MIEIMDIYYFKECSHFTKMIIILILSYLQKKSSTAVCTNSWHSSAVKVVLKMRVLHIKMYVLNIYILEIFNMILISLNLVVTPSETSLSN